MKSEVEIGVSESFAAVTVCIITKMFYGYLPVAVSKYGPAAWYISIISAVITLLVLRFSLTNGGDIIENFKASLGSSVGRFTAFLLCVYFLLYTSANLHEIVRIIKIYNFPTTPAFLLAAGFIIMAVLINRSGLFCVGKVSRIYIRLIIAAFAVIFILGFGQYDFVRLAPVGGYGLKSIAKGSVIQLTVFSELFLLLIITKQAGGRDDAKKSGMYALISSAIIVAFSIISYTAVFDYTVARGKSSGLIEVVKNVYYGHLFQRMESLFFLMMVVASAISVCVWFFASVHLFSEAFDIPDKKEVLCPAAIIVLCLSLTELNSLFNVVCCYGGVFLLGLSVISGLLRRKT